MLPTTGQNIIKDVKELSLFHKLKFSNSISVQPDGVNP